MLLENLFNKYYTQISASLVPTYKKALGKIYITDIQRLSGEIRDFDNLGAIEKVEADIQKFQVRYKVEFKKLSLFEEDIKMNIKSDIEIEWSGFFKKISVLIDNHDFYGAIETRFRRYFEGVIKAAELLVRDISLIVEVQKTYEDAQSVGKSKERLVKDLRFLSQEPVCEIFNRYFSSILGFRDNIENYSEKTPCDLKQIRETLSFQIEHLISEEHSIQSEHERFFLDYRLHISQYFDPLCETLRLFNFRAEKFRSEFIAALIGFEKDCSQNLGIAKQILDAQLEGLLQEVKYMQRIEQTNERSRAAIKHLGQTSQFQFFQDVAEESQQLALRSIGDTIRDIDFFSIMIEEVENIEKKFRDKINGLLETERQYTKLRQTTLNSVKGDLKFSIGLLALNSDSIDNLFTPHSSYRLVSGPVNRYDREQTKSTLDRTILYETLLAISDLGDPKRDPITVASEVTFDNLLEALLRKSAELGIGKSINFTQVLIDEQERIDIPHILFFCKQPQESRPEIVGILEIRQQGKLLYIKKTACILPLPSHTLNELLNSYKLAFRANSKKVSHLIEDEFLANKLKVDFQGQIAQAMTQTKRKLKDAYLDDLKKEVIVMLSSDEISKNNFLRSVDNLIIEALDSLINGDEEKPIIW
jgi:hypothetical protein